METNILIIGTLFGFLLGCIMAHKYYLYFTHKVYENNQRLINELDSLNKGNLKLTQSLLTRIANVKSMRKEAEKDCSHWYEKARYYKYLAERLAIKHQKATKVIQELSYPLPVPNMVI